MQSQRAVIPEELSMTFHFINGQSRTYNISSPVDADSTRTDNRQVIRRFLKEDWWVIQTPERTVFINAANVLTVEVNPPMPTMEGEGILHTAEFTTPNRSREL
jgi:hypothetical protein